MIKKMMKQMGKWKGKNIYEIWDTTPELLKEISEDHVEVETLKLEETTPVYQEKTGKLDYVMFQSSHKHKREVRILRLIRIKSIPSSIRTQMNNKKAFEDMLKEFGDGNVSFIKIDAYKPGEDLVLTYGVLQEGLEKEKERLLNETKEYIGALRAQFKGAYDNIQLMSLTRDESWIFMENFNFSNVSWIRGIPQPDSSKGEKTGASIYGSQSRAEEESEVFYKGMISEDLSEETEGTPFLLCSMFQLVNNEREIHLLLDKIHDTVSRLKTSQERGIFESENVGLPIMMGLGLGSSEGTNEQHGLATNHGISVADGVNQSHSDAHAVSDQNGSSNGFSTNHQVNQSQTDTISHSRGESAGARVPVVGVGGDLSWGNGDSKGNSNGEGWGDGSSSQTSHSTSLSDTTSTAAGSSHTRSTSDGKSETVANGRTLGSNQSTNLTAGASVGSSMGVSRTAFDATVSTALEKALMHLYRLDSALSVGLFEGSTFILTPDKQAKIKAESLYKQAFMSDKTPFPLRIEKFNQETERKLIRYAKMLKRTDIKEKRKAILEKERLSTYYTVEEMTAFDPIQTNLPGYTTSHEPIPKSLRIPGKMPKGAFLGNQLNSVLNEFSRQPYYLLMERLSHIGVYGNTGLGKTKFLKRLATELHNCFDTNIILFDQAQDYRSTINYVKDKTKFRLYTFDQNFLGFRINLIKPPKGVPVDVWSSKIATIFCDATGLGIRSHIIVTRLIRELLKEQSNPTMHDLAEKVKKLSEERNSKMIDFNEKATLSSMNERFQDWLTPTSSAYHALCGEGNFIDIEEFVKGDFFRVIECGHLPENLIPFVINGLTAAIYLYCRFNDRKLKPTYTIFEEAHTVLAGNTEEKVGNETIYEEINRFARKFGLYSVYVCQDPAMMPLNIFNCTPLQITFQIPSDTSKKMFVSAGGRDPIRQDVDLVNWLSRQPRGVASIRQSVFDDVVDGEFSAFRAEPLPMDEDYLDNEYFKTLYYRLTKTVR